MEIRYVPDPNEPLKQGGIWPFYPGAADEGVSDVYALIELSPLASYS